MAPPFAASWALTVFASCVEMVYATAFLAGFFSAIVQLATQVRGCGIDGTVFAWDEEGPFNANRLGESEKSPTRLDSSLFF